MKYPFPIHWWHFDILAKAFLVFHIFDLIGLFVPLDDFLMLCIDSQLVKKLLG